MEVVYIEESAYKQMISGDCEVQRAQIANPHYQFRNDSNQEPSSAVNFYSKLPYFSTKSLKEDKPVSYYVWGYIIYVVALLPLAYAVTYIDDYNTHNTHYETFYERNTFYTTYFSCGKFIYWMLLAAIGFTFVNVVNLGYERKNPWKSRDGSYKDIKKLIPIAFALFFASALVFLRGEHDMQRNCQPSFSSEFMRDAFEKGIIQNAYDPYEHFAATEKTFLETLNQELYQIYLDFRPIFFFDEIKVSDCKVYTHHEMFIYNYYYLIIFFIGLNFTHLDNPPFNEFTLEWDIMKNWPWYLWALFVLLCSFLILNVVYLLRLYYASGVLPQYILFIIGIGLFFVIGNRIYDKTRKLHIHHYVLGAIVTMLAGYQNYYVTTLAGIFAGIMIEGSCRWGFDPIWEPK